MSPVTEETPYRLVDALPESEFNTAARILEAPGILGSDGPSYTTETALLDDEPETEEEHAAVVEARTEPARGEGTPAAGLHRQFGVRSPKRSLRRRRSETSAGSLARSLQHIPQYVASDRGDVRRLRGPRGELRLRGGGRVRLTDRVVTRLAAPLAIGEVRARPCARYRGQGVPGLSRSG